ncbi:hypothetical protein PMIN07_010575 [Paraphaeosphaeria minitans]
MTNTQGLSESDAFDNYIGIDGSVSVAIITGIVFGTIALWLLVFLAYVLLPCNENVPNGSHDVAWWFGEDY